MSQKPDREQTLWEEIRETGRLVIRLILHAWLLVAGLVLEVGVQFVRDHVSHTSDFNSWFVMVEVVTAAVFVGIYTYKLLADALKVMSTPGWPQIVATLLAVLVPVLLFFNPALGMFRSISPTGEAGTSGALVLMGSDNVRSVIWNKIEPLKPMWVDVGSGPALRNIFQAFYYGRDTGLGGYRLGLSALSSNGLDALLQEISTAKTNAAEKDCGVQLRSNYWLCLRVATLPLAFLYRGGKDQGLPDLLPAEQVPHQAGREIARYVKKSQLDKFFTENEGDATRHIPDPGSGTRERFDPGNLLHWTRAKTAYYQNCLEHFSATFGELVTAAPFSCSPRERAADCGILNPEKIFAAAVCMDDDCKQMQWADFDVVIKIQRTDDGKQPGVFEYRITNAAECKLASVLSDGNIGEPCLISAKTSGVTQDKENHIVKVEAVLPDASQYLNCRATQ